MEVIPVINCADFDCVIERVKKAEDFAEWVHLDVSDARFTFGKSWGDHSRWPEIATKLNLEVHLMVEEPDEVAEKWLNAGAKRLIVHLETINDDSFDNIKKAVDRHDAELMLAVNPETPVGKLKPYFGKVSEFQVLAVYPGPAGQNFLPAVLEKIKILRQELPNAKIEVDGGINLGTVKRVKSAGADSVTSATYIFGSVSPSKAYQELVSI